MLRNKMGANWKAIIRVPIRVIILVPIQVHVWNTNQVPIEVCIHILILVPRLVSSWTPVNVSAVLVCFVLHRYLATCPSLV